MFFFTHYSILAYYSHKKLFFDYSQKMWHTKLRRRLHTTDYPEVWFAQVEAQPPLRRTMWSAPNLLLKSVIYLPQTTPTTHSRQNSSRGQLLLPSSAECRVINWVLTQTLPQGTVPAKRLPANVIAVTTDLADKVLEVASAIRHSPNTDEVKEDLVATHSPRLTAQQAPDKPLCCLHFT